MIVSVQPQLMEHLPSASSTSKVKTGRVRTTERANPDESVSTFHTADDSTMLSSRTFCSAEKEVAPAVVMDESNEQVVHDKEAAPLSLPKRKSTLCATSRFPDPPPPPVKKRLSVMNFIKSFSGHFRCSDPELACTEAATTTTTERSPPKVRFGTIQIREYPIEIGSGGVTRIGAPIGLGWYPVDERILAVDEYEHQEPLLLQARLRRTPQKMYLTSRRRAELLSKQGFTMAAIVAASKSCVIIRRRRASTVWRFEKQQLALFLLAKVLGRANRN
jgi:hypothetical protein